MAIDSPTPRGPFPRSDKDQWTKGRYIDQLSIADQSESIRLPAAASPETTPIRPGAMAAPVLQQSPAQKFRPLRLLQKPRPARKAIPNASKGSSNPAARPSSRGRAYN